MSLGGRTFTIRAGAHEATVVEVGAGLQRYTHDGTDVTVAYPDDTLPPKCCGVTLVPWPNRIRGGRYEFDGRPQQLALTEPAAGNAIHGLGRWARWTKVKQADDAVTLRLDVVPQNGYPWPVRVDVTYALDAAAGLSVTVKATNNATTAVPFGVGAHPYLATHGHRLEDVTVQVPARQRLVVDDRQIPVGVEPVAGTGHDLRRGKRLREARFDDGFTGLTVRDGRGSAEVRTRSGGARLWFDEAFRYLQVFTVDALVDGRAGVAVEPMTGAPDAFNSGDGLIVLAPRETWTASWGIAPL
jgi:aldose 1-epimerase